MPYELVDLEIDEVSCVDTPANNRTFLVIKRAADADQDAPPDAMAQAFETLDKAGAVMAGHRRQRLHEAIAALQAILAEAMPPDDDDSLMEKGAAMADKGAVVDGNVAQHEIDTLRKRAESAEAEMQKALATVEDLSAKVATLEADVAKSTVALAKALQTPEDQEAEYMASLPDVVRKQRAAEKAEMVELKKQLQETREEKEQVTYIQKTAAFRNFGITPDHWNILKAIDLMPEQERVELTRLMTAAANQRHTADLYKAVGSPVGASLDVPASAEGQLMSLTKAYQAEHKCDMSTAQQAIMREHPDVYQAYVLEKRRMTRVASE